MAISNPQLLSEERYANFLRCSRANQNTLFGSDPFLILLYEKHTRKLTAYRKRHRLSICPPLHRKISEADNTFDLESHPFPFHLPKPRLHTIEKLIPSLQIPYGALQTFSLLSEYSRKYHSSLSSIAASRNQLRWFEKFDEEGAKFALCSQGFPIILWQDDDDERYMIKLDNSDLECRHEDVSDALFHAWLKDGYRKGGKARKQLLLIILENLNNELIEFENSFRDAVAVSASGDRVLKADWVLSYSIRKHKKKVAFTFYNPKAFRGFSCQKKILLDPERYKRFNKAFTGNFSLPMQKRKLPYIEKSGVSLLQNLTANICERKQYFIYLNLPGEREKQRVFVTPDHHVPEDCIEAGKYGKTFSCDF